MSTQPHEEWRSVEDFVGIYEVSSLGRVRRVRHYNNTPAGGLLSTYCRSGYPSVGLWNKNQGGVHHVHRLVATAFHGPCPPGHECRHMDGNRANCVASNLRWGTRKENNADKHRHGTAQTGERCSLVKITEATARQIAQRHINGERSCVIARALGVTKHVVHNITTGRTWKHIPESYEIAIIIATAKGASRD